MNRSMTMMSVGLLIGVLPMAQGAEDKILPMIPANVDAIVSIDIAKLAGTEELKHALDSEACKGIKTKLNAFGALTGIDPMKDLDYFYFFRRVDGKRRDTEVFALQGRLDEKRLTQLISINEDYSTTMSGELVVHQWVDQHEESGRYGVFLPDGVVLVAESLKALNGILHPEPGKDPSLAKQLVPQNAADAFAWIVLPSPERPSPKQPDFGAFHVKGLNATLSAAAGTLSAKTNVFFDTDASAAEGVKVVEGMIALGKLQDAHDCIKTAAQQAKVSLGEKQSVVVDVSVNVKEAVDKLADAVCRH